VRSDENGQFGLANISPGSYVVGVGLTPDMSAPAVYARTMFPATIEVRKGNRVDAGTLLLPPASRRYELTGLAVGADGAPIATHPSFSRTGGPDRPVPW
jgi:hypothetical protein